jgi:hypothetical protein
MIEHLRKFVHLSAAERFIVGEAALTLVVAAALSRFFGVQKATRLLTAKRRTRFLNVTIDRAAALVDRTGTVLRVRCLAKAVAVQSVLSRRGVNSTLVVGVTSSQPGFQGFRAHAWVECGPAILVGGSPVEYSSIWRSSDRRPA